MRRVLVRPSRSDPAALPASLAGYSTALTAFLLFDSTPWGFAGKGLVFLAAIWWTPGVRVLTAIAGVVALIYAVSIRVWGWSHQHVRLGIAFLAMLAPIWIWLLRTPETSLAVALAATLAVISFVLAVARSIAVGVAATADT